MIKKVTKLTRGRSGLSVPIAQEIVDKLNLKAGEAVKVRVHNGKITVSRLKQQKIWTEQKLLKGITRAICGPELIPNRRGKEII
jgi:antitoxin component of MazEF toxin-antitoxin module